jgi:peptide/nickel transport system substrate-binding protein
MLNPLKKIRFFFRLVAAFWRAHRKVILFAFFSGTIIASLLPTIVRFLSRPRSERIGIVGKYTLADFPEEVLEQMSRGLTKINPDGSIEPGLASFWEIKNGGKIYQFTIGDDFFWHDDTPVTATDINFNFSDVLVKKIDEKRIQFELKEAFSPFLTVVSRPVFKENLVGMGDYRIKSVKRNGQILEKVVLAPVSNEVGSIVYKFYPTETMAKTAFELGEIDKIEGLLNVDEFRQWPNIDLEERVNNNRLVAVLFNTRDEFLAEKPARQALNYILRKSWPNRALGPISPLSWAYNPNLKRYEFDSAKAGELLEKALGPKKAEEIKITLTTFPSFFSIAEEIIADWSLLGIKAEIEVVNVIPEEFQALLVVEDLPADPDQYLLWHSTQPGNLSRFKSAQIDKLLEDGRKIFDQDQRKEIYLDFQRFLVEDAPAIFLYHPTVYTLTRK